MRKKLIQIAILLIGFSFVAPATGFKTYKQWEQTVTTAVSDASLPSNFCWIPMLLTDFNPDFADNNAAGAWALSIPVAHKYSLVVTDDYDARKDLALCTAAAVAYLKDLYAAENGNVEKVLERYVVTACRQDLLSQKSSLMRKLDEIAADYQSYKEPVPVKMEYIVLEGDVIASELCSTLGVSASMLREWNLSISPSAAMLPSGAKINIPAEKARDFSSGAKKLYASASEKKASEKAALERQKAAAAVQPKTSGTTSAKPAPKVVYYKVKRGDTLTSIARRYSTTIANIKKWNNMRSDAIRDGQTLKIYR